MLKYQNITFANRKELKKYLGSDNEYNRCLKNNKITFINSKNNAIDDKRRIKEYS